MKKIEFKPLIISLVIISFQSIIYLFSKLIQGEPHLIGSNIDTIIPFISAFIVPYVIWYFLLFTIPYHYYAKDKNTFIQYFISYIVCVILGNITYVVYPSIVVRPEIISNDIFSILIKFIYAIDTPALNCFPSLHCAISMLWFLFSLDCNKLSKSRKIFNCSISILIMMSTLFIKQHVFIDLVAGNIMALIAFFIAKCFNTKKAKELLKI